ncbi:hypothetical protein BH11PLA2_BH11PLA2_01230 [soil metagenome]
MLLDFPTLDSLRFALMAGLLPAEAATVGGTAPFTLELPGRFTKDLAAKLTPLGISTVKTHREPSRNLGSVFELFNLEAKTLEVTPQTPVLFHLRQASDLPVLTRELLRLGNDRQSYCTIDGDAFLKVIGPPYYTLLRAIDPSSAEKPLTAYVETAPRVWVQAEHSHPFANRLSVPESQLLLLTPQQPWRWLKSLVFQDLYDILEFPIAAAESPATITGDTATITVPLRLAPGNAADVPELWVLGDDALDQLDQLARDGDARLLEQLHFAVFDHDDGTKSVLLRTRPGLKLPPVLTLASATAYRSFWRLPNLFLPAGTRLHPSLRRDAVTKLLAPDVDKLVWLAPVDAGAFQPWSVADDSFRPLSEWVDYVISDQARELSAWMDASVFMFDSLLCSDTAPPVASEPVEKVKVEPPVSRKAKTDRVTAAPEANAEGVTMLVAPAIIPAIVKRAPSEWKLRCDQLEKEFVAIDGPLDDPRRIALWSELATANAALGPDRRHEADLCRLNAAWASQDNSATWTAGEKLPSLDSLLKVTTPTPGEMRDFAVQVLSAKSISNLAATQRFFESYEDRLPVRMAWFVGLKLAEAGGGDVLGLARCRDHLLTRLLERGLSPEHDFPAFLRYAGLRNSEQARLVRERLPELHSLVKKWTETSLASAKILTANDKVNTPHLADLIFAFGLATLGEQTVAQTLLENARKAMEQPKWADGPSLISTFLVRGFKYRIDTALEGKPLAGPLPEPLLDQLQHFHTASEGKVNTPEGMAIYAINRLREDSRLFEPLERVSAYADTKKNADDLTRQLALLPRMRDAATLMKTVRELYKNGVKQRPLPEVRLFLLHDAILFTPRAGLEFAIEILNHVPEVVNDAKAIDGTADLTALPGRLIARSVLLAAHVDRLELIPKLLESFFAMAKTKRIEQRFEIVNAVAGECLRSFRKAGLREESDRFLKRLQSEVLEGQTIAAFPSEYSHKPEVYAEGLRSYLALAAGWLGLGLPDLAQPMLDAAREVILAEKTAFTPRAFAAVTQAYISTLGHGPAELALDRITELFTRLDPTRIRNSFTTAPYYSRLHLNLIEETVLALVSDDSTVGQEGRRWLNEDEHLVRRRIHRDFGAYSA